MNEYEYIWKCICISRSYLRNQPVAKKNWKKIDWFGGLFQEAQDKLWELDRLSNKLDAFVEKTKNATIEETEVRKMYHFITQISELFCYLRKRLVIVLSS